MFGLTKSNRQEYFGDFSLDLVLGRGHYGEVRLAWRHNQAWAVKLISLKGLTFETIKHIGNELDSLQQLQHPYIIRVCEAVIDGRNLGLVMEWARSGDLFSFLQLNGPVNNVVQARLWFAQLVSAVDFMQSESFIHHDIKPENLLIDKDGNLILTDFEMCQSFRRQGLPFVSKTFGSPTYCSPELMFEPLPYDGCKADVWAMGVTLYTLVTGYLPFEEYRLTGAHMPATPAGMYELYKHIFETDLEFPDHLDSDLRDLISGMLVKDPKRRVSLVDIKSHVWLKQQAILWNLVLSSPNESTSSFNSDRDVKSLLSLSTLSDTCTECTKQVRGPIIWDPDASIRDW